MNTQLHRVIFNKVRRMFMAVAETSRTCTAAQTRQCHTRSLQFRFWPSTVALAVWACMATEASRAQIIADTAAPASQRATVLMDAMGRPLVNIQTPGAGGVSRNTYRQFDVQSNGVTLNNSRHSNPWLATGEARVILNEVNSSHPSHLRGAIKVQGASAQVIVANPSGIQIDGARFINANRVTLTTGTPDFHNGELRGLRVEQGTVNVGTGGLDVKGVGYTEIISRVASIAGAIEADESAALSVIAGVQVVDNGTGGVTNALEGSGERPLIAIDSSVLGGMYAGKITLLATESGVGVRHAGKVKAGTQLVVTADGRLENTGQMQAPVLSVATVSGDIDNAGTLQADTLLNIHAGADFLHSGVGLVQQGTNGPTVMAHAGRDVVLAGGASIGSTGAGRQIALNAERDIRLLAASRVSADGAVQLSADGLLVARDAHVASSTGGALLLAGQGMQLSDTHVAGDEVHLETGSPFQQTSSNISVVGGSLTSKGTLVALATGHLSLDGKGAGNLRAGGDMHLQADLDIDMTGGVQAVAGNNFAAVAGKHLAVRGASAAAQNIDVVSVNAGKNVQMAGGSASLSGSQIVAGGKLLLETFSGDVILGAQLDQSGSTHNRTSLAALGDLSVLAYGGDLWTEGLQASGRDVSLLSNGVTHLGYTTTETPERQALVASVISAREKLIIGSVHESARVQIDAATLEADSDIQVIGQGSVLLKAIDTRDSVAKGNTTYRTKSTLLRSSNVAVQGDEMLLDGTQIESGGNVELHASKLLDLRNSYIQADHVAATSAVSDINITGVSFDVTSSLGLKAKGSQRYQDAYLMAANMRAQAEEGSFILNNTHITTATPWPNPNLVDAGHLSIESGAGMAFDARSYLFAWTDMSLIVGQGDITLSPQGVDVVTSGLVLGDHQAHSNDITIGTRNGVLTVAGKAGTAGNPTAKVVDVSGRNLNLFGTSVVLQAPKLKASGDLNIVAHGGNVVIDGVKSSFAAYVPKGRVDALLAERSRLDSLIAAEQSRLNTNPTYVSLKRKADTLYAGFAEAANVDPWVAFVQIAPRLEQAKAQLKPYTVDLDQLTSEREDLSKLVTAMSAKAKGAEHRGASITGSNINITSVAGLAAYGAEITATDTVNLNSMGTLPLDSTATSAEPKKPIGLLLAGLSDIYQYGAPGTSYHAFSVISRPTVVTGQNGVNVRAMGADADVRLVVNDTAIKSAGMVHLQSLGDMRLEAGQEEFYSKTINTYTRKSWLGLKKKTTTEISTSQSVDASPVVLSANDIVLKSGGNIDAYATEFLAPEGRVQITAADALNLYAIGHVNINQFDARSRSSFLGVTYSKGSSTSSRAVSDQLPARVVASGASTASGWNTLLQGTIFRTGLAGATISAGVGDNARADAQILLEGIKRTVEERKTKESNYVVWQRQSGSGSTVETMKLPSFSGPQAPVFNAPGGLVVQVPEGNLTTQIQALNNQPGLAYLSSLSQRSDVNWQPVHLAYEQWQYEQEGLTGAGAALVAVAVAWATGGMGAEMVGATKASLTGAAANAAFVSLSSQAAISLINNQGNIGKTLSDLARSDVVKATVTAVLTAGVLHQLGGIPGMDKLKDSTAWTDKLTVNLVNAGGRALTTAAITGGSLEDALRGALLAGLIDTVHGSVAGHIKGLEAGYLAHKLAHALAGCAAGAAAGGECRDGAIGAAVGEVVAELFDSQRPGVGASRSELQAYNDKVLAYSKLVAGGMAAYAGGNAQTAITTAEIAVQNNYLSKPQLTALQAELQTCKQNNCNETQTNAVLDRYVQLSAKNDADLAACTTQVCVQTHREALLEASSISRDVMWDIANANANERLIQELLGRQNKAGTLQHVQRRVEHIERANREMAQYVQTSCQGLSQSACTTKLQQSQDTAGAFTEIVAGFTPAGIAVDIKDLLQAQTLGDYSLAVLGAVLPGLGDGFKAAIKGAPSVPNASTVENLASGAASLHQQQLRRAELAEVFDAAQARSGITIGNQSYLPRPDQAVNIYDGLSWDQVQRYFLELTGARELPVGTPFTIRGKNGAPDVVGTRYTLTNANGESFTLRDAARSKDQSGPVWTVDVPGGAIGQNPKKTFEIKFGM